MIDDYHVQKIVAEYALNNRYTLVANTPGSLEYVKFETGSTMSTMKWSKGSDTIIITVNNSNEKIKIEKIQDAV